MLDMRQQDDYGHFRVFEFSIPEINDFRQFYRAYLNNQENFRDVHGVLAQPQTPPPVNAYTVSCKCPVSAKRTQTYTKNVYMQLG